MSNIQLLRIESERKIDITKFLEELEEKEKMIQNLENQIKDQKLTIDNLKIQVSLSYFYEF